MRIRFQYQFINELPKDKTVYRPGSLDAFLCPSIFMGKMMKYKTSLPVEAK